jgi:hypothetical protein
MSNEKASRIDISKIELNVPNPEEISACNNFVSALDQSEIFTDFPILLEGSMN